MSTVTVPEHVSVAVDRGVAILDQARPGWRDDIDLDQLDVASNPYCVLGQLYGTWGDGCRELRNVDPAFASHTHGFTHDDARVPIAERDQEYVQLTEEWRRRIHPEVA